MEALYHATNRMVQEAQELFQRLEREVHDPQPAERAVQAKLDEISKSCDRLDILAFKAPINQRPIAKMRCDQLKYDNKHMQAALTNYINRRLRREQERSEREQLLSRRFTGGHPDTAITVDYAARENASLMNSHQNVDEMIHTGSSILDTLKSNRETLKGAHRRIIDLANTLGLSNATISLIERRVSQDKYVLLGGMFLTIVVISLVIVYLT